MTILLAASWTSRGGWRRVPTGGGGEKLESNPSRRETAHGLQHRREASEGVSSTAARRGKPMRKNS
jgi:hypothetical protein